MPIGAEEGAVARRAVPRLWGAILGGLGSEQRRHAWGGWQVGRGARGQWCNGHYVPSPWDLSTKALCIYTAPPPPTVCTARDGKASGDDGDAGGVAGGQGRFGSVRERRRMGESLMLAVKERNKELVRGLLETGQSGVIADASWADEFGVSCVHVACKLGDVAIIQLLVAYGADWQARDVDGATPLHYAAMCATDRGGGGGGGDSQTSFGTWRRRQGSGCG
jgi:hypothetical protein